MCRRIILSPLATLLLLPPFVTKPTNTSPRAPRFGLAIGANLAWLVRAMMWLTFPIAYPIGAAGDG